MESVGLMEPLLPPEGTSRLDDLVVDLVAKSSGFDGFKEAIRAGALYDPGSSGLMCVLGRHPGNNRSFCPGAGF